MQIYAQKVNMYYTFIQLANDYKISDELNLEVFIKYYLSKTAQAQLGDTNYFDSELEKLKTLIHSIEFPNKFILNREYGPVFGLCSYRTLFTNCRYGVFDKNALSQVGLEEGVDYANISQEVNSLDIVRHNEFSISCKDCITESDEVIYSFNGLKKLVNYLHTKPVPVELGCYYDVSKVLDFEVFYKKTKEAHAKNRKAYLAEIARVNGQRQEPLRSEIPFAIKLYENKFQEVQESKPQAESSAQNGMIIYKRHSGRSKTIISKNIEDELESIMEDLETISISHFDVFTREADDSDIIVIESINKKDILKAMKLYK